MTYGQVARRLFPTALALIALAAARPSLAGCSASPTAPSVTLLSVGASTLQVMDSDGRARTIAFSATSQFLRRGIPAMVQEFTPGETLVLRTRITAGGRVQVVLLCDPDSAAVIKKYRGRPCIGTILSATSQAWVVQPSGAADPVPLTLRLSSQTTFRAGGAPVAASAFGPGVVVTVTTRSLPNGLLSAVSVSDAAQPQTTPPRQSKFVSGQVTDVQPNAGTLTVQDKMGNYHAIAVDGRTRIKIRKQPASLADITNGMHISAWLGTAQDAFGNPLATSILAYDAPQGKK